MTSSNPLAAAPSYGLCAGWGGVSAGPFSKACEGTLESFPPPAGVGPRGNLGAAEVQRVRRRWQGEAGAGIPVHRGPHVLCSGKGPGLLVGSPRPELSDPHRGLAD